MRPRPGSARRVEASEQRSRPVAVAVTAGTNRALRFAARRLPGRRFRGPRAPTLTVVAGRRQIEVVWVMITDAGRRALTGT